MTHDVTLIGTVAVGLALAFGFGFLAQRLRLPPLVGYLVAGVVVGRFISPEIADGVLAGQLAEIGIMLMMFGVGLHFSVSDLLAVRRLAIPGAVGLETMAGCPLGGTVGRDQPPVRCGPATALHWQGADRVGARTAATRSPTAAERKALVSLPALGFPVAVIEI